MPRGSATARLKAFRTIWLDLSTTSTPPWVGVSKLLEHYPEARAAMQDQEKDVPSAGRPTKMPCAVPATLVCQTLSGVSAALPRWVGAGDGTRWTAGQG